MNKYKLLDLNLSSAKPKFRIAPQSTILNRQ